jgi:hypothetical protein
VKVDPEEIAARTAKMVDAVRAAWK